MSTDRKAFIASLLMVSVLPSAAAEGTPAVRFKRLGSNLICCFGCGDGLLSCNHVGCQDDARMLRELREQIAKETRDRPILQWFAAKYGSIVLAAPLRGGFDNAAWIILPLAGISALSGVMLVLSRWRKRSTRLAPACVAIKEPDEMTLRIRRDTAY